DPGREGGRSASAARDRQPHEQVGRALRDRGERRLLVERGAIFHLCKTADEPEDQPQAHDPSGPTPEGCGHPHVGPLPGLDDPTILPPYRRSATETCAYSVPATLRETGSPRGLPPRASAPPSLPHRRARRSEP